MGGVWFGGYGLRQESGMKAKILEELSSLYKARSTIYEKEGHSKQWHHFTGRIEAKKKQLAEAKR